MALADAVGNLTDFRLLPGQAHDLRGTGALIDGLTCGQLLADRAFDADWLREAGRNRFLLTAPPLRLPGAVGSPATPVATV